MNPVIKTQVNEYSKSNALLEKEESIQFEIYSIFCTLSGLLGENVEAYDVHLSGQEFGVDGIAILIQGELVRNKEEAKEKLEIIKNANIEFIFFQSKTSTSYDYGDVSKFFDGIEDFFENRLENESQQISELTDAMQIIYEIGIGRRNPRLTAFYISTGNYEKPTKIEKLKDKFQKRLEEKFIFDANGINIRIIGARELQSWYRAATTSVEVEIDFPKSVVMPATPRIQEAYIGYLSASELVKLISTKDADGNINGINKSVFFDNIRDYDPSSKINNEIKSSVKECGGVDFVFKNNGVTVVSRNIDRTADRFKLEDFQIVNGCQTSNIIYDIIYGSEKDNYSELKLEDSIFVPFRLIGSKDDEFVGRIIVGTNKQNPVKEEQFWALRPFMKNFEEYSRSTNADEVIYFERRENQYRGQDVERVRIIQPSVMLKALAAMLLFQPHRAARDYRSISQEFNKELFQDNHDVTIYHAVCFLYYRFEFLWRNQKISSDSKTYRFYILCAVGLLITAGNSVFKMKRSKIQRTAKNLINLAKNEEVLKIIIKITSEIIEAQLKNNGSSSQEKIRDTIRSISFSNEFCESIKNLDIPEIKPYITAN